MSRLDRHEFRRISALLLGLILLWGASVAYTAEAGLIARLYRPSIILIIAATFILPFALYLRSRRLQDYADALGPWPLTAFHIFLDPGRVRRSSCRPAGADHSLAQAELARLCLHPWLRLCRFPGRRRLRPHPYADRRSPYGTDRAFADGPHPAVRRRPVRCHASGRVRLAAPPSRVGAARARRRHGIVTR
jgi:hypothetical protein